MIDLVCLPFAGGNKYSYMSFKKYTNSTLNIITLELPGRGKRFDEPLQTDVNLLVEDLYMQIEKKVTRPYAIFGHSMGAILTFLLAHKITTVNFSNPLHLFVSGARGPKIKRNKPYYHNLPKEEFVKKMRAMGGFPEEILINDDLMEIFEPALRADFKAIETYNYQKLNPLEYSITVLIGDQDKVTNDDAISWQDETIRPIEIKQYEGDHFFIFKNEKNIIELIKRKLRARLLLNNY